MAATDTILQGVSVNGKVDEIHRKILTPQALAFLALLHRSFNGTRKQLLERRKIRQAEIDRGVLPDFLPETKHIRENATWKGAVPAPGLVDRRVEITGPTDRKMVVNALNAEVYTYMADFEGEFFFLLFFFFFKCPLLGAVVAWGATVIFLLWRLLGIINWVATVVFASYPAYTSFCRGCCTPAVKAELDAEISQVESHIKTLS